MRAPGQGLRVAVIGTRGLPATYGGVERHVEELSRRLVARGHEVTVFCRDGYADEELAEHLGIRLVHLPVVEVKGLEALSHSTYASLRALRGGFDLVAYHAVGPGLAAPLPRYLGRLPVVQTVHGLDADRAKWGRLAKTTLGLATWMSARVPHATIVVSEALAQHYATRYGRSTWQISNGVDAVPAPPPGPALARLGLEAGRYVLFVGRLVPEKAPDRLLRAFRRVAPAEVKLAVVGGSSFTDDYVADLHRAAQGDPRIVFPGYQYGADLHELYAHAGLFVLPSDLEGLPLTLLEAASFGTPVLASDIPPHLQVVQADGPGRRLVTAGDEDALAAALARLLAPGALAAERGGAAQLREDVLRRYSWDAVTSATEAVYDRLVAPPVRPTVIDLRDTPRTPDQRTVFLEPDERSRAAATDA